MSSRAQFRVPTICLVEPSDQASSGGRRLLARVARMQADEEELHFQNPEPDPEMEGWTDERAQEEIQALQTKLGAVPKPAKPVRNKPATQLDQVHHALESQASTKTSTKGEFERQNSQELRCLGCFIRY